MGLTRRRQFRRIYTNHVELPPIDTVTDNIVQSVVAARVCEGVCAALTGFGVIKRDKPVLVCHLPSTETLPLAMRRCANGKRRWIQP